MSDTKAPSKKAQAIVIFNQELAKRTAGTYDSNKAFRAATLGRMTSEIVGKDGTVGVSQASAATMYNECKKATGDDTIGRDPKKVTVKVTAPVAAPVEEVVTAETAEVSE